MQAVFSVVLFYMQILCLCWAMWQLPMPEPEGTPETVAVFSAAAEDTVSAAVNVLTKDGIVVMPLETYLVGVVLAEMPAEFQAEALKAQAVAARTYTWKRMISHAKKHPQAHVCTDAACCQGYISAADYLQRTHAAEKLARVTEAVRETEGLILTFQGEPIDAAFFSCSGGFTEDAAAVWGGECPYLKSRESPGEELAFCYTSEKAYTKTELETLLQVRLGEDFADWFRDWAYTAGSGVDSVFVGDRVLSGTEIRKRLRLNSTAFSVAVSGDRIVFLTKGYGHRVGLSQYGAEAMARQGKRFVDILLYYYDGVDLEIMK